MKVLVVAEHDGVSPRPASLACLSFARQVAAASGGSAEWLILGHQVDALVADAARYAPVLVVDSPAAAHPLAAPLGGAIAQVVEDRGFDLVCAAASTFSKDVVPRAAALLGGAMASDVVAHEIVEGRLLLHTPRFAGAVTAVVRLLGSPQIATVRASSYQPAQPLSDPAGIERLALGESLAATSVVYEGLKSKESKRPDVTEAKIVVSGGRALKNSDDFERLVGRLADVLGAATGSSRALVDAGITPNELQVGQTGKIVAPDIYLALGISGAVQHLAGMKNSRTIVAVNSDPEAPIFELADYGLVGDVYEVVPKLIEELEKHVASAAG